MLSSAEQERSSDGVKSLLAANVPKLWGDADFF